jgi:hypothetical protein
MDVAVKERSEVRIFSIGCTVFVMIDMRDAINMEINRFR